jgi:hypothetical protein
MFFVILIIFKSKNQSKTKKACEGLIFRFPHGIMDKTKFQKKTGEQIYAHGY